MNVPALHVKMEEPVRTQLMVSTVGVMNLTLEGTVRAVKIKGVSA